jgi:hypothetical protein
MKTYFISVWTPVVAAGILLLMLANPAAASLKRVIVLERPNVGFPPFTKTWEQQRLKLSQIPATSPDYTTVKSRGGFSE